MPGLPIPILAALFETIPDDRPDLGVELLFDRGITALVVEEPTLTSGIVPEVAITGANAAPSIITGVNVSEPSRSATVAEIIELGARVDAVLRDAEVSEVFTGAVELEPTGAVVIEPATGLIVSEVVTSLRSDSPVPTGAATADVAHTAATVSPPVATGGREVEPVRTGAEML